MLNLPPEIALLILSYLRFTDLCRASYVCRDWYNLCCDDSLWRTLYYNEFPLKSNAIIQAIPPWKRCYAHNYVLRQRWMRGISNRAVITTKMRGTCVQFDVASNLLAVGEVRLIELWDFQQRTQTIEINTSPSEINTVWTLQFRGDFLICGSSDKSAQIWNIRTRERVHQLLGHSGWVYCLQWDDEKLLTGSYDHTVKMWDMKTATCTATLQAHSESVGTLVYHDNTLFTGSYSGQIRVISQWDLRTLQCIGTLQAHEKRISSVRLHQDCIFTASYDGLAKIFDRRMAFEGLDHTSLRVLGLQTTNSICCIQVDEDKLVSTHSDAGVIVWDWKLPQTRISKPLYQVPGHRDWVYGVHFDERYLVTVGEDRVLDIRDYGVDLLR